MSTRSVRAAARRWGVAGAACGLALAPAASGAQSVSASADWTSSGYQGVLEAPLGFAVGAVLPLTGPFRLRASHARSRESQHRIQPACTGLVAPDDPCPVDAFDGDTRLVRTAVGLDVRLPRRGALVPSVFAGLQWSDITSDFVGRATGVNIGPVDGQGLGWHFGVAVEAELVGPVRFASSVRVIDSGVAACGADAWFPFCEGRPWLTADAGISIGWKAVRRPPPG